MQKELLNKAIEYHQSKHFDDAEKTYKELLKSDETDHDAHNLYGLLKLEQNDYDSAEIHLKRAVELKPNTYFYENLGNLYLRKQDYAKAIEVYKKGIELDNEAFELWFNLGLSYKKNAMFKEAVSAYEKALEIRPNSEIVYHNLANAYDENNDFQKSIECNKEALKFNPDNQLAKYFLSLAYMKTKNYKDGLECYEARLCRDSSIVTQSMIYPELCEKASIWRGEDITDKTLYTYYEAGFGDVIMFSRYLNILKDKCKQIIFQPQTELSELFQYNFPEVKVLNHIREDKNLDFDVHTPILSIPLLLGLEGKDVFAYHDKYLKADPKKVEFYKNNYFNNDKGEFKIGIKWQGKTTYDRERVITVESFFKLMGIKNTKFYSLQTYEGSEEISKIAEKYEIVDLGKTFNNFADTAGAIENLDLVISNDTSLVHLAGAMNKQCWVLLPYVYNWRWHLDLSHCDWYDSVKIFRQTERNDWSGVFDVLYDELKAILLDL